MTRTIVTDYRGRQVVLLSRKGRVLNGHRYVTRKSLKRVIQGKATHTLPRMLGTQAPNGWPSRASYSRVKVGCHIFSGVHARNIIHWALAA